MLFKTQLVHLSNLSARSLAEADWINELVRSMVIISVQSNFDWDDPDSFRVCLGRVAVESQQPSITTNIPVHLEQEIRVLNHHVTGLVSEVIDSFRLNFISNPVRKEILNIEMVLLNKNTVMISFEVY